MFSNQNKTNYQTFSNDTPGESEVLNTSGNINQASNISTTSALIVPDKVPDNKGATTALIPKVKRKMANYKTFSNATSRKASVSKTSRNVKHTRNLSAPAVAIPTDNTDSIADRVSELHKEISTLQEFISAIEQEVDSKAWKLRTSEKVFIVLALICWSIAIPTLLTDKDSKHISTPGFIFAYFGFYFTTSLGILLYPGKKRFYADSLVSFGPAVQASARSLQFNLQSNGSSSLAIAKALLQNTTNKYNELLPQVVIPIEELEEEKPVISNRHVTFSDDEDGPTREDLSSNEVVTPEYTYQREVLKSDNEDGPNSEDLSSNEAIESEHSYSSGMGGYSSSSSSP